MNRSSAIVIGGGAAGLSAAVRLQQQGLQVILIEQRSLLGGRAYAYSKPGSPTLDNGHHVTLNCYENFRHLLKTIGAETALEFQPTLTIPFRGEYQERRIDAVFAAGNLPAPLHLLRGLMRLPGLTPTQKLQAMKIGPAVLGRAALERNDITVSTWLKHCSQPELLIDWLWKPLCMAALNLHPDEASAKLFAEVLHRAFFSSRAGSSLGVFRSNLSQAYTEPALNYLQRHAVQLHLGATATRLRFEHERCVGVDLEDGTVLRADFCVSALPGVRLKALLDTETLRAWPTATQFDGFGAVPIVNAYLLYETPQMHGQLACLLGTQYQWAFDLSHLLNGEKGQLVSLTISDARPQLEIGNEELAKLGDAELRSAFRDLNASASPKTWVIKERRATMMHTPENEQRRPGTTTPFHNFFLAGDWTDTGLPCTLEGAAQSGFAAATAVLQRMQQKEVTHAHQPDSV